MSDRAGTRLATRNLGPLLFVTAAGVVLVLLIQAATHSEPRPERTDALGDLADPGATYDPVVAGEPLPEGFRQLLARDRILPVYDPQFVAAADSGWSDETLVIGLSIGGESRAYPVDFLNRREMVVDSVAGIPVLVTW